MRLIITKIEKFKAKGVNYVVVHSLSESGKTVKPFFSEDEYNKLNFPESVVVDNKEIMEMFQAFKTVDVVFDDNKRVVGVVA